MEEKLKCCVCGEELNSNELYEFNGEFYCGQCLDDVTVLCDCCGDRIRRDSAISDSNYTLCSNCFDEEYNYCESCGAIIANEDAYYLDDYEEYPYCQHCYNRETSHRYIHDYSYKPDPEFKGEGKRYFGVELEVDYGGKDNDNAKEVLDIANYDRENIYIKSDGSLDDGFEIVTHPMTLNYHINLMPWEEVMRKLIRMGYKSHKAGTCGLHIHINRTAFGDTYDEQENVVARILFFIEHNWDKIFKFSRRTEVQMERWAARYGMKNKAKCLWYFI